MRRFHFRLARLLELRERAEEERRVALERARAALRDAQEEHARVVAQRRDVALALSDVTAPGAASKRRDFVLHHEFLEIRAAALEVQCARLAEHEAAALEALRVAARERKVLTRLRDRHRAEFVREFERADQALTDEIAQRSRSGKGAASGKSFPVPRKTLTIPSFDGISQ